MSTGYAEIVNAPPNGKLKAGECYTLRVNVSPNILSGYTPAKFGLGENAPLSLDVTVYAQDMDIAPSYHGMLRVQKNKAIVPVEFIVTPKRTGGKKIKVEFYHQRHWLSKIVFDLVVDK